MSTNGKSIPSKFNFITFIFAYFKLSMKVGNIIIQLSNCRDMFITSIYIKTLHLLQIETCSKDELVSFNFSTLAFKSTFTLLRLEIE
jgi:hypothetical protein